MAWRCAQPGAAPGSIQCTASFLLRLPRLENQSVMAASPWPLPWGLHQCPRACRRLLRGVLHPPDPPLAASILRCTLAEAAREGQEAQPQGEGAAARLVQGPTFRISLGVGRRRLVGVVAPKLIGGGISRCRWQWQELLPPTATRGGFLLPLAIEPAPKKIEPQRGPRQESPCHEGRGRALCHEECPVYEALAPSRPGPCCQGSMQRGRLVSPAQCVARSARVVKRRPRHCWCPTRSGPVQRLATCSQSGVER